MSTKTAVVRGSGNAFRDLGHKNADTEQIKAILAADNWGQVLQSHIGAHSLG